MASEREIKAAYDATTECLELAKWLRDCIAETTQTLAVDGYPPESLADEAGEYLTRLADALPRAESAVNPLHRELVKLSDAPARIGTAAHWYEVALNWATMIYETVCDGVDPEGVRRGEIELTTDTWRKACAKLDGKIRDVDESVRTMLRVESAKLGIATSQRNEATDATEASKVYLTSWAEILGTLKLKRDDKDKVIKLNHLYDGPILPGGRGEQPTVERGELIEWHEGLAARLQELRNRRADRKATAVDGYDYGNGGAVAFGGSGAIKKRRADRKP